MSKFPEHAYFQFEDYMVDYAYRHHQAMISLNLDAVTAAAVLVEKCIKNDRTIFVCGNGGSNSIAEHLETDFAKGIATNTALKPKVVNLGRHGLVTAYGNDVSYDEIFSRQLAVAARSEDLLIAMSVSGGSPNVVNAVRCFAQGHVILMTGSGPSTFVRQSSVHIQIAASENYGICEDVFQSVMHMIAQYIRLANMDPKLIPETKF
jgi:D-sedoheptulose 7-phosphate isomerase